MSVWLRAFDQEQTRAEALAEAVAERLRLLLGQQGTVCLAVSGGSTPVRFFVELSQKILDWSRVNIELVDERCVASSHPDSNFALMAKSFAQGESAAATLINYLDESQLEDAQALQIYANAHFLPADIIVLGMGEDGHTASIFPGADAFAQAVVMTPAIVAVIPPKAPHRRLSMTLGAILQAHSIFLEMAGASKQAVLARARQAQSADLPISLVLHAQTKKVEIYVS